MDRYMIGMLFAALLAFLFADSALAAVTIINIENGSTKVEQVNASPMFTCVNADGDEVEWVLSSPFGDVVLDGSPPHTITEASVNGYTSFLTIEGATTDDSASLTCRSKTNPSDKVSFVLQVVEAGIPVDWVVPKIERRGDSQNDIEVEVGTELRLKCIGGAEDSNLVFKHEGSIITDDSENTLTPSGQINGNAQILILSRDPAVAGTYTCSDASYPDTQGDSIEVSVSEHPLVRVQIIEPSESSTTGVLAGDTFNIRCQASIGTDIKWTMDGQEIEDGVDRYIITNTDDTMAQTVSSLLTKEDADIPDGGEYVCANANDPDEIDSITVEVYKPGAEGEGQDDNADDDDDDDDDSFLDKIFGGASGLMPSTIAIFITALLTLGWGRQ